VGYLARGGGGLYASRYAARRHAKFVCVRVLCRVKAQRLVVNVRAASCLQVGGFVRQCARGGDARQGALALPHPHAA
jgi:hypothetical protein